MLLATLLPLCASTSHVTKAMVDDVHNWADASARFDGWKALHNISYQSHEEQTHRLEIFSKTASHVDAQNERHAAGELSYSLTLNRFSDLTSEEFRVRNGFRAGAAEIAVEASLFEDVGATRGSSFDWRHEHNNVVTGVKDQGQCGSCWAFSTTGSIEGFAAIANESFAGWFDTNWSSGYSESELVNCAPAPNEGCDGGDMGEAMKWIANKSSGDGLNSESNYRYDAFTERCDFQKERVSVVSIKGYQKVPVSSTSMIAAISKGPVAIAIDASSPDFQNYDRGVFNECRHTLESLDHGVLAVGYFLDGTDNSSGYVTVKNSWGGSWGMDGYIQLAYNAKLDNGTCGMNLNAYIPSGATMHPPTPMPPPPPQCSKGGLFKKAFYCDYGTTCCCDHKRFGKCVYTCCKHGEICPTDESAIVGLSASAKCTGAWPSGKNTK
jgi:C1A family cysteine protease